VILDQQIQNLIGNNDLIAGLQIFFALLIAHALFDYPLQGDFLSRNKNRHYKDENNNVKGLWIHCLTSHSILHAGSVWLITGSFVIGIMEFALHWVIDFLKCEGITNFHTDQFLHVLCRILYVIILWKMA
jgi:hypothetical protein|tara:strand:+ start:4439 stop:4828 length:390 start_codon:yes stop_codon:yes gene_type:complete